MQVLVLKRCIRYFKRMHSAPRFVTNFYSSVHRVLEPILCGKSTIFFWPSMVETYTGAMDRPYLLYNIFREELTEHL